MSAIFKLSVNINKDYQKQVELINQWPKRLAKIRPMLAYMGADYLRRFIVSKMPKGPEHKAYRSSLEVAKVRGTGANESAYTLQINPNNRLVKNISVHKTLLYVRPAPRAVSPSKKVLVLQKYGPWTYETLPFTPNAKEGVVISRPAKAKKVQQVTQLLARQRARYMGELQKLGVRDNSRNSRLKIPKNISKLPDVSLDAMKLEFGLGGGRPTPGWKVGISRLRRQGFKSFMKDKKLLAFPLTKSSFNLWKKWPPRTKSTISIGQAKKYKAFQHKVSK